MWRIIAEYRPAFLEGVLVTLGLSSIVWIVGLSFGSVLGWIANRYRGSVGLLLGLLSFLTASIPVIVVLFWANYPLQVLLSVVLDPFITAACVLSLVNVVAVAAIVKSALDQFPQQFLTAARVTGLTAGSTFKNIRLPIILRQITPSLLTSQVVMLQSTLFASMISVQEILRVAQAVNATEYKPVEIYSAVALFFLVICAPINGLALFLRRRYARDFSER